MDIYKINKLVEKRELEDSLKQEFELTIKDRVSRYLQVKPHGIIPNTHFAAASSECSRLFRDGNYYGCVSLTQAVTEALVKFLCKANGFKPKDVFEKNLDRLLTREKIGKSMHNDFLKIWTYRDNYHHLNPSIEKEFKKLEALAKEKLILLNKVEADVFAFSINNGKLVPKHPKYWKDTRPEVYLRLS